MVCVRGGVRFAADVESRSSDSPPPETFCSLRSARVWGTLCARAYVRAEPIGAWAGALYCLFCEIVGRFVGLCPSDEREEEQEESRGRGRRRGGRGRGGAAGGALRGGESKERVVCGAFGVEKATMGLLACVTEADPRRRQGREGRGDARSAFSRLWRFSGRGWGGVGGGAGRRRRRRWDGARARPTSARPSSALLAGHACWREGAGEGGRAWPRGGGRRPTDKTTLVFSPRVTPRRRPRKWAPARFVAAPVAAPDVCKPLTRGPAFARKRCFVMYWCLFGPGAWAIRAVAPPRCAQRCGAAGLSRARARGPATGPRIV